MIRAVIKGGSVIGKQTRGRFNFSGTVLAEGHFDKGPFSLVIVQH